MLGDYRFADRYEDGSQGRGGRRDRGRCASSPPAPRPSPTRGWAAPDRVTRDIVAFDATTSADVGRGAHGRVRRRPGLRRPGRPRRHRRRAVRCPTAEVADAMVSKYRGIGQSIRDFAERHREGVASGRTPATFAVERAIEQVERWLATPLAEDLLLTSTTAPPAGYDVEAWRGRLSDVIAADVRPGPRGVPRRAARRGRAGHAAGRAVRSVLAPRRRADLCPPPRPRHHHDPLGRRDPPDRPGADRLPRRGVPHPRARGGRHRRPPLHLPRACARTPRCGTPAPPRSSPPARPRSPRPAA